MRALPAIAALLLLLTFTHAVQVSRQSEAKPVQKQEQQGQKVQQQSACLGATSCWDCIEMPECGWCGSSMKCVSGGLYGPSRGSCSYWQFTSCSASPPSYTPSYYPSPSYDSPSYWNPQSYWPQSYTPSYYYPPSYYGPQSYDSPSYWNPQSYTPSYYWPQSYTPSYYWPQSYTPSYYFPPSYDSPSYYYPPSYYGPQSYDSPSYYTPSYYNPSSYYPSPSYYTPSYYYPPSYYGPQSYDSPSYYNPSSYNTPSYWNPQSYWPQSYTPSYYYPPSYDSPSYYYPPSYYGPQSYDSPSYDSPSYYNPSSYNPPSYYGPSSVGTYRFDPSRTAQYITLDATNTMAFAKIDWWSATQLSPPIYFDSNQTIAFRIQHLNISGLVFGLESASDSVYGPESIPGKYPNSGAGVHCNGSSSGAFYFVAPFYGCKPGDVIRWNIYPSSHKAEFYVNNAYLGYMHFNGQTAYLTVAMIAPSVVALQDPWMLDEAPKKALPTKTLSTLPTKTSSTLPTKTSGTLPTKTSGTSTKASGTTAKAATAGPRTPRKVSRK